MDRCGPRCIGVCAVADPSRETRFGFVLLNCEPPPVACQSPPDPPPMGGPVAAMTQPIDIRIADLDEVKQRLQTLTNERDDLRHLLQAFEERVTCPQCGNRYTTSLACGPSHAVVARLVLGPQPEGT